MTISRRDDDGFVTPRGMIAPTRMGSLSRGGENSDGIVRGGRTAPQDRPRCGCCMKPVKIVEGALGGEAIFPCRCQQVHRCGRCERCVDCCRTEGTCTRPSVPAPRPGVVGQF